MNILFLGKCFAIVKHTLIWLIILYFLTFQLEGYQYHSTSILLYIYYILFYCAFIHISLHITVWPVCIMNCVVDPEPEPFFKDPGLFNRGLQILDFLDVWNRFFAFPSPYSLFWLVNNFDTLLKIQTLSSFSRVYAYFLDLDFKK